MAANEPEELSRLERVKQVTAQFIGEYERTGVLREAKLAEALDRIYLPLIESEKVKAVEEYSNLIKDTRLDWAIQGGVFRVAEAADEYVKLVNSTLEARLSELKERNK